MPAPPGGRDLGDDVTDLLPPATISSQRLAEASSQISADLYLADGITDQFAISFAAVAERPARLRTSVATTAKPRPLFASTGGLDRGVERQQIGLECDPSITPMDLAIRLLAELISAIAPTARPTTSPPRNASWLALLANWFACWAFAALLRTVDVSSSPSRQPSAAAPTPAARCVRNCYLPTEISPAPVVMSSVDSRSRRTMLPILATVELTSSLTLPKGTGIVVFDRLRHVAGRHPAHRRRDITANTLSTTSTRSLMPFASCRKKPCLPCSDTRLPRSPRRRIDDTVDFGLYRHFLSPVGPFDHRSQPPAVISQHRVGYHPQRQSGPPPSRC